MDEAELQLSSHRSAYALFCDDVRHEASGKLIIVGLYGDDLIVPSFPSQLPSLNVIVTINTPNDQPFRKLVLRVYLDDEVLLEQEMDPAVLATQKPLEQDGTRASNPALATVRVNRARSSVGFSPFMIPKACVLRVRVFTESEILPAGVLRIQSAG